MTRGLLENMFSTKLDPDEKVNDFLTNNPVSSVHIKKHKGRLPYSVFKPHSDQIVFIKSIFQNRPPTIFFTYPKYTKKTRESDRLKIY